MELTELKSIVEGGSYAGSPLIFADSERFICHQYLKELRFSKNLSVEYVEDISQLRKCSSNLFGEDTVDTSIIRILDTETLDLPEDKYSSFLLQDYSVIICSKIKSLPIQLTSYVVTVPSLEPWQIKDFLYSTCTGVPETFLDNLQALCKNNIHRLEQESYKFSCFTAPERKTLPESFSQDSLFDDLTQKTVFNFTNAITKRDLAELTAAYKDMKNIDLNEMGLITLLYQNFKNIISVQLSSAPTPSSTGLSDKQFYAVKYSIGHYSKEELTEIFELLTRADYLIKSGELPISLARDYLIFKIMRARS